MYIGPYEIIEDLNFVVYRFDLSVELDQVQNVFFTFHNLGGIF